MGTAFRVAIADQELLRPNVAVHPAEGRRKAPLPRIGCNGWLCCTCDGLEFFTFNLRRDRPAFSFSPYVSSPIDLVGLPKLKVNFRNWVADLKAITSVSRICPITTGAIFVAGARNAATIGTSPPAAQPLTDFAIRAGIREGIATCGGNGRSKNRQNFSARSHAT